MINKRRLGRTGLHVSEIGFGAWAVGGKSYGEVSEKDAVETIEAYLQAGGNLIDTARMYGESERHIGNVLSSSGIPRSQIVIVTKSQQSASVDKVPNMWRDLETSLKLMRTDYVDVLMMHSPSADLHTLERCVEEMTEMKRQGLIRFIGASIKGPSVTAETVEMCRQYIRHGGIDVFQLIYSILRQRLEQEGMLWESREAGVGLIIRTVLESGFLTGKYAPGHRFSQGDHRRRWDPETLNRILRAVDELRSRYASPSSDLAALSIQFALANPDVATVIIGAKTPQQLQQNIKAAQLPPLSEEILNGLREFGREHRTEIFNL